MKLNLISLLIAATGAKALRTEHTSRRLNFVCLDLTIEEENKGDYTGEVDFNLGIIDAIECNYEGSGLVYAEDGSGGVTDAEDTLKLAVAYTYDGDEESYDITTSHAALTDTTAIAKTAFAGGSFLGGASDFVITVGPFTTDSATAKYTVVCRCLKPESSPSSQDCFSGEDVVTVENKGSVAMKELSVGDAVLGSDGRYEAVLGFYHKNDEVKREFLQFHVENEESPLEITANHLIYKKSNIFPVAAHTLKEGDMLIGATGEKKIIKIDSVTREGIYAPMTASGQLMVNGLKTSNYVALQRGSEYAEFSNGISLGISQHTGVHMFTSPFRVLCMNGFASLCTSFNADGMPTWVDHGIKLANFADKQNTMFQLAMLVLALLVFVPLYSIEILSGGNLFVFAASMAFVAVVKSNLSVQKIKSA